MTFMGGLWEAIRRLIETVFSGGGKSGQQRTALREIHARLKGMKPPLLRPRTGTLQPGLAERLHGFSLAVRPLELVFRYSLAHEDPATRQRYRDLLLEARLPPEARRLSYTYNEMKRRLSGAADRALEAGRIHQELTRHLDVLDGETFRDFDATMHHTARLGSLCRFRFDRLLKLFDGRFDPARTDYRPAFHEIPAEAAMEQLLDLVFIVAGLQIGDQVVRNVHLLADRVFRDQGYDREDLGRSLEEVRGLLVSDFNNELLTDLIRGVENDPTRKPRVDTTVEPALRQFKQRVAEEYERDRDRVEREGNLNAIQEDVKALFEGADLLTLTGYSDDESTLISHSGLEAYAHVFPMRILKSFNLGKFENQIKVVVKKLLLEGFFEDREFQESLSAAMFACDKVQEAMAEFENAFGHGGRFASRVLHKLMDSHRQGKAAVTVQAKKTIRETNQEARDMMEHASALYFELGIKIKQVLEDYKSHAPEKVSNVRVIGGDANSAFIGALLQAYNDLRRLVQVMRSFAVVAETV